MFNQTSTIRIKYINPNIPKLERIGGANQSAWIDVRASEVMVNGRSKKFNQEGVPSVSYKTGDIVLVKLGFALQMPQGYEGHLIPRSGTFKNFGLILTNGMGLIDSNYCGDGDEWMLQFIAMRDGSIFEFDRVGQFRIIESMNHIHFEEVDSLGNENRGGYGSTGTK